MSLVVLQNVSDILMDKSVEIAAYTRNNSSSNIIIWFDQHIIEKCKLTIYCLNYKYSAVL